MHRYDWAGGYRGGRRRGPYDPGYGRGPGRFSAGYDLPFRGTSAPRGDPYGAWGYSIRPRGFRGYDRGEYGSAYPGYGGYPGDPGWGMYYGGGDRGFAPGRGWGGYDGDFADRPFLPDWAYTRDRPPYPPGGRWPPEEEWVPWEGPGQDDDEIVQAVREALYQDTYVEADRIDVDVNGGVVTLTGDVDDFLEARYAWDDAWETPGVRGVINQLTVRTDLPVEEKAAKGKKGK